MGFEWRQLTFLPSILKYSVSGEGRFTENARTEQELITVSERSPKLEAPARSRPFEVHFIQRRPAGSQISIERLFSQIRGALSDNISAKVHVSPCFSKELIPRVQNVLAARQAVGTEICHITGDVHYLALGLQSKQLILTIHDCAILYRLRGWRREVVRRLWFDLPMRRSAIVTTISETTQIDLRRWVSPQAYRKIRVIPNCVGSDFVPRAGQFKHNRPTFLQVGTGWNKNLERVCEALRGIRCKLEVVGPLSASQKDLLDRAQIDYVALGKVDDQSLVEAYRRADALIFASLFEGFGLPIIEAQAIGRPVITSNRSSMPEVAGDGALFVDPEDPGSIRMAIMRLISEKGLAKKLVELGNSNVQRFRPNAIAAQYEMIYRELHNLHGLLQS